MQNILDLSQPVEFDWDEANRNKVRFRHGITPVESEQPFVNDYGIFFDNKHSQTENPCQLIGANNTGQVLFIVFTLRGNKVRIISARSANKKERALYAKEIKKDS